MSAGESLVGLPERLAAELDRLEAIARQAMEGSVWDGKQHRLKITDGQWTANGCHIEGDSFEIYDEGGHSDEQAAHIAANDPAHVMRTIRVHRKWLDRHRIHDEYDWLCVADNSFFPCETVVDLASIYLSEEGT